MVNGCERYVNFQDIEHQLQENIFYHFRYHNFYFYNFYFIFNSLTHLSCLQAAIVALPKDTNYLLSNI